MWDGVGRRLEVGYIGIPNEPILGYKLLEAFDFSRRKRTRKRTRSGIGGEFGGTKPIPDGSGMPAGKPAWQAESLRYAGGGTKPILGRSPFCRLWLGGPTIPRRLRLFRGEYL